jgi:YVTN family beta-propeller protein
MKPEAAFIAGVVALACAVAAIATASGATSRQAAHPRVGKVLARIPIAPGGGGLALGEGAVWSTTNDVSTLTRIDPDSNAVVASIQVARRNACPEFPRSCGEVAAGNGAVWVSHPSDNTMSRIDARTNRVTATIPVGPQPTAIGITPGAVWVANIGGPSVSRIDPATNQVVATISVGPARACCSEHMPLTVGGGAVWVGVPSLNRVVRIDPSTNSISATIKLSELRSGQPCGFLAAMQGAVWVAGAHCPSSSGDGVVTRIDANTNSVTRIVRGFSAPIGLALGFGSLWVGDLDAKTIDRVNRRKGRVAARLRVGGIPIVLGVGFGSVWVRDDGGRVLRIKPQR